jgi:hypothetical protein
VQTQQKVPFGVDPKTVLCQYFKAGTCTKGDKCKFSHNADVERKGAKIDIYTDARENDKDQMEDWDQSKLEDVVSEKHGKGIPSQTEIVCKFFLEAIEQKKYGWFWQCPNGGDKCQYRHALPPGFVLKSKEKKSDKDDSQLTLEEYIDQEVGRFGWRVYFVRSN